MNIKYEELPPLVQYVITEIESGFYDQSSSYEPGLGLSFKCNGEQRDISESKKLYTFEIKCEDDVPCPACSVSFLYERGDDSSEFKYFDIDGDFIDKVEFRFYGNDTGSFVDIAAGIGIDLFFSNGILENHLVYFDHPKSVDIYCHGNKVYSWAVGADPNSSLQNIFGNDCTLDILRGFCTRKVGATYDRKQINREIVIGILERFADKLCVKSNSERFDLQDYVKLIQGQEENYKIELSLLNDIILNLSPWLAAKRRAEELGEKDDVIYMRELSKVNLPNFAFLGEPGTGKTELAKRLVENVLGGEILTVTATDLKGNWVGHTRAGVVKKFIELEEKAGDQRKPTVLFIDEAYSLFGNGKKTDSFSDDIIEILLKALEPGERLLTAKEPHQGKDDKEISVRLKENTAVWLGGYEKDMRKALSVNKGMFRRVQTITLPIPDTDALKESFFRQLKKGNDYLDEDIRNANYNLVKGREKVICDFFTWARSKTYAEFFGNYAGVKKLVDEINKKSLMSGAPLMDEKSELEEIIEKQKREIRTQYQQVIEDKFERLPFMVYTDVEENFEKYIGADGAKEKLNHVIDMFCSPDSYKGCAMPKGALLMGPPGTGKTYLAKCMAGELRKRISNNSLQKDVAFIKVAATELRTAELVKALFSASESYDCVVIFIDEIDAIGRKRETLGDTSVLIQLMNELDGFDGKNNLFVLAATNAPEALDNALKRPGRFDMTIEVGAPNSGDRQKLVKAALKGINISEKTVSEISKDLGGCTPVEINTIINDARILNIDCTDKLCPGGTLVPWAIHRVRHGGRVPEPGTKFIKLKDDTEVLVLDNEADAETVREGKEALFLMDFREALAQRTVGERSDRDLKPKDFLLEKNDGSLSATALHETGHAMVFVLHNKSFEKITVLARGGALGYVEHSTSEKNYTKQDFLERIDISFGGRAAEEIVFGHDYVSGGAISDIRNATQIARDMVMMLGMNDEIGPMALLINSGGYLGAGKTSYFTDNMLSTAEEEIHKLLKERYKLTLEALKPHKKQLEELAEIVFEKEEMSGEEFLKEYNKLK